MSNQTSIESIAADCKAYSLQYKCSLYDAVKDWERDGPQGSGGLSLDAQRAVAIRLGIGESFGVGSDPYEY